MLARQPPPPAGHYHQLSFVSDLTFDNNTDMDAKLSGCLQAAVVGGDAVGGRACDYDTTPYECIGSLKVCLLDAIHTMYIKGLAVMPVGLRLLCAVLAVGTAAAPWTPCVQYHCQHRLV
jgi:hypothetical protein